MAPAPESPSSERPWRREIGRGAAVALALGTLTMSLAIGAAIRAPCGDLDRFFDPDLGARLCYTDITALWADRRLGEEFPYLEAGNEYPVGTGALMGVTALAADDEWGYLLVNEVVLSLVAVVTALLLVRLVGTRALFFTAAPGLAVYSFLNWDLFALSLSVGAIAAFLAGRDRVAGSLAGLGAAAKVFPGLLVPAFAMERIRGGDRRAAIRVALWSAVGWLALNIPVAALRPERWAQFFRFNSRRPVDPASLWGLGCTERMTGLCPPTGVVNLVSLALFVGAGVWVWRLRVRRQPDFPRWTFGFALMLLFLLTNKVYSPQYSLWLLPWFALVLPDVRRFLLWSAIDVAAWAATLAFVRRVPGFEGPPFLLVKGLVLARGLALMWLLVSYVRRPTPVLLPESGARRAGIPRSG